MNRSLHPHVLFSLSVLLLVGVASVVKAQQPAPLPVDDRKITVFRLQHAAARDAAKHISAILEGDDSLRVAIDERTNSLITFGKPDALERMSAILEVVDRKTPEPPVAEPAHDSIGARQVRVDWLVSDVSTLAGENEVQIARLEKVVAALEKTGITNLELAAQTLATVNATTKPRFELSCSPSFGENVSLEIDGVFTRTENSEPELAIQITAFADEKKRRLAHISTVIVAPVGHPIVLAVAPMEDLTSVFVITVENGQTF